MTKLWYMYLFVFLENQHNIEQINSNFGFDINNKSKESTTTVCAYASRTKRSANILAALSAKCMSVLCKAFWNSVFYVRALRTSHTTVFGRTWSYETYCRPLQERSIEKSVRLATVLEIIRSTTLLVRKDDSTTVLKGRHDLIGSSRSVKEFVPVPFRNLTSSE